MTADDLSQTPSRAELEPRLARLRDGLEQAGLDAALLVVAADVYHLSGTAQNAHLIVPVRGEPLLLVRRDLARARAESALEAIEPLASLRGLEPALAGLGLGPGSSIGLELDVLPASSYLRYAALLPDRRLADAMPAVWAARAPKSPWELERVRAACEQGTAAMRELPAIVRVGRAEVDVLSELAGVMRAHGHEGTVRFRGLNSEFFFGQVLGGPSAAVPGPTDTPLAGPGLSPSQGRGPSRRPLADGDAIVVDLTGLAGGYVSDQTRTVFLGDPDPRLVAAYETCTAILHACEELLVPGTPASALYERGLEVASEAGFADNYMGAGPDRVRFVGHAIGLELNEAPALARGAGSELVEGAVIAVEPKLLFPRARRGGHREQLRRAPRRPRAALAAGGRADPDRPVTPRVDADLYRRLFAELAAIGAGPAGWNRLAWGPLEDEARSWFLARASDLGLEVEQDGAGNLWAVEPDAGSAPLVCAGSHVDTVLDGGAYDGALGVVAALVAVEAVRREGPGPRRPLAVGCMVDEEGPRFDAAIFGSRMLAGELAIDELLARVDRDGNTLGELAAARGVTPDHSPRRPPGSSGSRSGSRCTSSRGSRSSTCRRPWGSRRGSRRASAGARRSRAPRTTRGRRRWPAAATRSWPPHARSSRPSSSRSPSRARWRPSAASRRARGRAT